MYAMIATSIALVVWTAGLSYVSARAEKRSNRGAENGRNSRAEEGLVKTGVSG